MPPARSAGGRGRRVTNKVNNAHYSAVQPRIQQRRQAGRSAEAAKNRSFSGSSCNPGFPAQDSPRQPPTPETSPSKRWQTEGYVEDSEASETESEVELPERQIVPDIPRPVDSFLLSGNPFTTPPSGYNADVPEEYQVSNWVTSIQEPRKRSTSIDSVATEALAPDHYEKKEQQAKEDTARNFHQNGDLPYFDPNSSMEQPATQHVAVPRVNPTGGLFANLSDEDRSDILCILSPNTPAAFEAVKLVAENTPQHILHYDPVLKDAVTPTGGSTEEAPQQDKATEDDDKMAVDDDASAEAKKQPAKHPLEIALRLNSKIRNPVNGFAFGRDPKKADILISTSAQQRISGLHFRIYLNNKGSLMCQDESINGTWVDGKYLRKDGQSSEFGPRWTVHDNNLIELLYGETGDVMRFTVRIPDRTGVSQAYGRRLDAYIGFLGQLYRQNDQEFKRKTAGIDVEAPDAPILPFAEVLQGQKLSSNAIDNLVAGTEPYYHGMHWNGGVTYQVTGKIGKGAFATVYKLVRRHDGEVLAVKEVDKTNFVKRGNTSLKVTQELNIMKRLQHYIDHHETPRYLYIVMEHVSHGDLQTCLNGGRPRFQEYHCQSVASQMCQALKYLHDCSITHRDIKPDNILISSIDPYEFKLSDFGLSKVVNHEETFLKSFCGTLLYCAPEVYPGYDARQQATPRKRRRAKDG
ncbi:MAG: hypothetical protein Q9218_003071, partial [Villophora microphyllina]